jgi:hypothetical protein
LQRKRLTAQIKAAKIKRLRQRQHCRADKAALKTKYRFVTLRAEGGDGEHQKRRREDGGFNSGLHQINRRPYPSSI